MNIESKLSEIIYGSITVNPQITDGDFNNPANLNNVHIAVDKIMELIKFNHDNLIDTDEFQAVVQNSLYSTCALTTIQCEALTDGIAHDMRESGYAVVKCEMVADEGGAWDSIG